MSRPLTRLWSRIEPILDAVVDLPEPLRTARVRDLCSDDPEVGAAVTNLLRADSAAGDFMSAPPLLVDPEETLLDGEAQARDVDRIGPFRVVRELGRGGMGRVLLGERDDGQFEQRVAIKILHGDLAAAADRETLVRERRILARLEHPRIARMYDGGVTSAGEPYFVMEHVDGLPLDEYCRKLALPLRRRLELFGEVCRAVEFAHGRFIIHCDIKPRNILVTADGDVKLLDFGIASLLEEESQVRGPRVRSFTPAYAAPEQVRSETVTAATDVYQLGVVLRGLLHAEEVPSDLQAIVAKALRADPASRYPTAEALRRDLEDFLVGRPVAAFGGSAAYRTRKWVGRYRWTVAAGSAIFVTLALGLVGVAVQASAAARARDRAASAERRVSAVNEFVLHELLEAPMPEVAMGRDLTVGEVLGNAARSVEHAFQGQPAAEAEVRLTLAHTYAALGRSVEAGEHARAARMLLAGAQESAPALLDRAERTLAGLALDEGRIDEARKSLEALHARQLVTRGAADVETLWTSAALGQSLRASGDLAQAEHVLRSASETARRERPDDWRLGIEIDRLLSDVLSAESQGIEAESVARSTLDAIVRNLGPDHPERIRTLTRLALALNLQLRYVEAAAATEESLALSRRVFGPDHPATADTLSSHAMAQERLSRYDEALAAVTEALTIRRKTQGPSHHRTVNNLYQVGVLTANAGRGEEAVPIFEEVIAARASLFGESHPETIRAMKSLNLAKLRLGREDEAREVGERMTRAYEAAIAVADVEPERLDQFAQHLLAIKPVDLRDPERAVALAERAVAATGRGRYNMLRTLGDAYAETGRPELALGAMREVLVLPDGMRSWSTTEAYVSVLGELSRGAEIPAFLREHRERQLRAARPDERMVAKTERLLALELQKSGDLAGAEEAFLSAEVRLRRALPPGNWEIGRLVSEMGGCRVERGNYAEAERLLLEGLDILEKDRATKEAAAQARARIVKLYEAWGKPAEADRFRPAS